SAFPFTQLLCQPRPGQRLGAGSRHTPTCRFPMLTKKNVLRTLAVLGGLVVLVSLSSADPVFALQSNQPFNFGGVESKLQGILEPVIELIRTLLALAAGIFGFYELLKASRGGGGCGWMKAIILLIVAAVLAAPSFILDTLGMTELAETLEDWGFCSVLRSGAITGGYRCVVFRRYCFIRSTILSTPAHHHVSRQRSPDPERNDSGAERVGHED